MRYRQAPNSIRFNSDYLYILIISAISIFVRFFTFDKIAHSGTSDSYMYSISAYEISRIIKGVSGFSMHDLELMHPMQAFIVGVLKYFIDIDTLTLGSILMCLMNASVSPLVYVLCRQMSLKKVIAFIAAFIMLSQGQWWVYSNLYMPNNQITFFTGPLTTIKRTSGGTGIYRQGRT